MSDNHEHCYRSLEAAVDKLAKMALSPRRGLGKVVYVDRENAAVIKELVLKACPCGGYFVAVGGERADEVDLIAECLADLERQL